MRRNASASLARVSFDDSGSGRQAIDLRPSLILSACALFAAPGLNALLASLDASTRAWLPPAARVVLAVLVALAFVARLTRYAPPLRPRPVLARAAKPQKSQWPPGGLGATRFQPRRTGRTRVAPGARACPSARAPQQRAIRPRAAAPWTVFCARRPLCASARLNPNPTAPMPRAR
jgi:hypothetical protein